MSTRTARFVRRGKRKSVIKIVLLVILAIISLAFIYQIGVHAISFYDKISRDVRVVEYGRLEDKQAAKAIFLNKEETVTAEYDGRFENMVKDHEKISKGSLLGYYISSQGHTPIIAHTSGIFTLKTDGLETVLGNLNLQGVGPEIFQYQTIAPREGELILAGQAVYKIVDNLTRTRLLVHYPLGDKNDDLKLKQQINVVMAGKDLGKAAIIDLKTDFGEQLMMLELTGFHEDLLNQRYVDVELVFGSYPGYILPVTALVEKEGKKGVFCTQDENIIFKAVEIIKIKDDKAVVEGLNKNDLLVINPRH